MSQQSYNKLTIPVPDSEKEIMIAWLNYLEADSIVESEDQLEVYTTIDGYAFLSELAQKVALDPNVVVVERVENKNWNALWESNFEPIQIAAIYVRATFHKPTERDDQELIIAPKMAFGTGHHPTTYMMIDTMQQLDLEGKSVFDYGCGTGILSVLAYKLGAKNITAVDIQEEAEDNFEEHLEINGCPPSQFRFQLGQLEQISGSYDVILANINRHVLLEKQTALKQYLKSGGLMVMSGILDSDRDVLVSTYKEAGWVVIDEFSRGEWNCFHLRMST